MDDFDFFKKGTRIAKLKGPADKSNQGTTESVLDGRTRMILFKMLNKGIFDDFRGCISTGKEANVYRAVRATQEHTETVEAEAEGVSDSSNLAPESSEIPEEAASASNELAAEASQEPAQSSSGKLAPLAETAVLPSQLAVKVYKTAVLAFKDRERYVAGEYRFRHGYSKHNHRQMVKMWAEKETRNLKRIYKSGIPVPKPFYLFSHILVMEFLGNEDGYASPRLRDADIESERFPHLYRQLLAYIRIMYQQCRLVHADLSEYNILYHQSKLWIIDVSQSVEHDHPSSLTFLRMDIKNVNDYFTRQGVNTYSEIQIFKFVTTSGPEHSVEELMQQLSTLEPDAKDAESAQADAIFREIYIPRTLDEVFDVDRDVNRVNQGGQSELVYRDLLVGNEQDSDSESESGSESGSEGDSEGDSDDDEVVNDVWDDQFDTPRKFADRDANKERKKQVKLERRDKRANKKLRKKDKKRLVAKSRSRK